MMGSRWHWVAGWHRFRPESEQKVQTLTSIEKCAESRDSNESKDYNSKNRKSETKIEISMESAQKVEILKGKRRESRDFNRKVKRKQKF